MPSRRGRDRLVRAIGDVTEAHVSTTPETHPTGLKELPPEESIPPTLDWEHWLGIAQMRPHSSWYVPYNWRGFFDFGTGQIGNWATHTAGPVHHALQLGAPSSVECISIEGKSDITFPNRGSSGWIFPRGAACRPLRCSITIRRGRRIRTSIMFPAWRTRQYCRRRTIWRTKNDRPGGSAGAALVDLAGGRPARVSVRRASGLAPVDPE